MWSYVLKRLLLMIPTLFGILPDHLCRSSSSCPAARSSRWSRSSRGARRGAKVRRHERQRLSRPPGGGCEARRGNQEALRIRQAGARALLPDARAVRALRSGQELLPQQGRRQLILEKLPVSISLGLWTFLLVYLISLPLGIAKAVRAGTRFDTVTTFIVLLGYAIPSFVMGVVLLVLFAGGSFVQWFPLRGLTSANWDGFEPPGKDRRLLLAHRACRSPQWCSAASP